jgi:hypothetical protein
MGGGDCPLAGSMVTIVDVVEMKRAVTKIPADLIVQAFLCGRGRTDDCSRFIPVKGVIRRPSGGVENPLQISGRHTFSMSDLNGFQSHVPIRPIGSVGYRTTS